jgi:predicted NUDIX family phosphoesterase
MTSNKDDEQILVIKSEIIFENPPSHKASAGQGGKWQGLKTDNLGYYIDLLKNNCEFKRRGDMENDPSFQQIIPYILFSFKNYFFAYKYLGGTTEKRLVDTYQLGLGGHINPIDNGDNILEAGMMREWEEEVSYAGKILEKKLVGILKDESGSVEKVHIGLVYNFIGDGSDISIKENEKMEGMLVEPQNIWHYIKGNPSMWTQIIYKDYISKLI